MFNFRAFLISILLLCSSVEHVQASGCLGNCQVSEEGVLLIKQFEGFFPYPYKDVVGIETIGFGHVIRPGEKINVPLLGAEAHKLLKRDIDERNKQLAKVIKVPLQVFQYDALASFNYNVGIARFSGSSVLRRVNAKRHDEVRERLMLYNKAGGKVFRGLTIRREVESKRYEGEL